jgi:anti-anti-sigma factor
VLARRSRHGTVLSLAGEFDTFGVEKFESVTAALADDPGSVVVADMGRLEFLDTSAVVCLTRCSRRFQEMGKRLVVRRPPRLLLRIMAVIGDDDWLELEDPAPDPPLAEVVPISDRKPDPPPNR